MSDNRSLSKAQEQEMFVERKLTGLRVCLPGKILSFDAAAQLAKVQPLVKMKLVLEGQVSLIDLPPILNVPVVLPYAQAAGLLLTLPLQPDDECLLVFADRAIDNIVEHGGLQPPESGPLNGDTMPRSHSLTDAICIPGFISQPNIVDAYSTTHIELRDKTRTNYISLGPDGITITDGQAVWKMSGGAVELSAPAGITSTDTIATQELTGGAYRLTAPSGITVTDSIATQLITAGAYTLEAPASALIHSAGSVAISGDGSAALASSSGSVSVAGSNMALGKGGTNTIKGSVQSTDGTFVSGKGISLDAHVHSGVESGSGSTGGPR